VIDLANKCAICGQKTDVDHSLCDECYADWQRSEDIWTDDDDSRGNCPLCDIPTNKTIVKNPRLVIWEHTHCAECAPKIEERLPLDKVRKHVD
jgi:hypothetical protein